MVASRPAESAAVVVTTQGRSLFATSIVDQAVRRAAMTATMSTSPPVWSASWKLSGSSSRCVERRWAK